MMKASTQIKKQMTLPLMLVQPVEIGNALLGQHQMMGQGRSFRYNSCHEARRIGNPAGR
jgi:hypothetical protein